MISSRGQQNFEEVRRTMFWGLLLTILIGLIGYGFLINKTVLNIVQLETGEEQVTSVSTSLSDLQSELISLKKSISINEANELGFAEPSKVIFISKADKATVVSLGHDQ